MSGKKRTHCEATYFPMVGGEFYASLPFPSFERHSKYSNFASPKKRTGSGSSPGSAKAVPVMKAVYEVDCYSASGEKVQLSTGDFFGKKLAHNNE